MCLSHFSISYDYMKKVSVIFFISPDFVFGSLSMLVSLTLAFKNANVCPVRDILYHLCDFNLER